MSQVVVDPSPQAESYARTAPPQPGTQAKPARRAPLPFDGITVVVPCYNEERSIAGTARQIHEVLDATGWPFEIVFVNDGSTDGTADALANAKKQFGLTVVNSETNCGYGASLKRAIAGARHEIIVITDADGTYPNERIPELIELLRKNDMIVGARIGLNVNVPLIRRPAKWFLRQLAGYLAGRQIPDLNSGLRVMKRSIVQRFVRLLPDGFSFTTTISLAMLTHGYHVHYEPIDYHARVGKSSIRPIRDTANFLNLIVRTVMYFKPLKIFGPISAALFAAALIWGVTSVALFGKLADVSALVLAMTSLHTLAIGLLADLIDKRSPSGVGMDPAA